MRTVTIVRHRVADFDRWKAVYDSVADLQRSGGVREHAVLRDAGDPSLVTVVHTFDDRDAAQAFFAREELREALGAAGVDMSTFRLETSDEVLAGRL